MLLHLSHLAGMAIAVVSTITVTVVPALAESQPNIILIVSDDAGYGDFSMHGGKSFPTPRIDNIAKQGVLFTQGYVSASVCSPSRAGMLTGKYQQKFGHENNIPPRSSTVNGMAISEKTIADYLKKLGYHTIAIGKWHLGYDPKFHPFKRGFNEYYGFLQGARSYWPMKKPSKLNFMQEGGEKIEEDFKYTTDALGQRAAKYIKDNKEKPFFMYLAFNAVHTPMHALNEDLKKVNDPTLSKRRKILAAMTIGLDRAVGYVIDELDKQKLTENTIVVFINDNGGAASNSSFNGKLRGKKGTTFEGGTRVPFVMQWPKSISKGRKYNHPVSSLDLLSTFVNAAGCEVPVDTVGVDILPYINGANISRPHKTLFWKRRSTNAVRDMDWKLVTDKVGQQYLFDIASDPTESIDLSKKNPKIFNKLLAMYKEWDSTNKECIWGKKKKAVKSDGKKRKIKKRNKKKATP